MDNAVTPPPEWPLEPCPKAIIVGASSGIGAALARRLSREGYRLALLARRLDRLEALCEELDASGGAGALAYRHDVTQVEAIPALLQRVAADLGGLDLFAYSAGVMFPNDPAVYDAGQDRLMLEVNAVGAAAWISPVAQRFERAGSGHIVAIGSLAGVRGRRGIGAYSASKAALHAYLEAIRNRVSRHGVKVTTVIPGQVETDMLRNADRLRSPLAVDRAAELIWRAVRAGRQTAYIPAPIAAAALVLRHIPSFVFRRLDL